MAFRAFRRFLSQWLPERLLTRLLFLSVVSCQLSAVSGQQTSRVNTEATKKIALTFEQLPYMKPLGFWSPREISNMILRALDEKGIKAAGFVVEEKIDDDPSSLIVLDDWAGRGHIIGNQTWAYVDLNQLSADDFLAHVADGQKYLWRISKRHPVNFRYLRFPLLHEGGDQGKKKDVANALYRNGYEIAPVTVKTSSYLFNRPYLEQETDTEAIDSLRKVYLEHLGESLDYAETQSEKVFGRQISHILQLHSGIATAAFLEDLIAMLQARGYQFISLPEALDDSAYETEETYVGPLGLSFIDRVAATREMEFDSEQGEWTEVELQNRLKPRN
ncbi:MAG: polysaccharide deacetylase family protein [Acidobacteriota bacterium]